MEGGPGPQSGLGYVCHLGVCGYAEATDRQRLLRQRRRAGLLPDLLLLTEHPATYTCGRGTRPEHLHGDARSYARAGIELHEVERGGSATYHGPGQLVGYPIVDLRPRGRDVHNYMRNLEQVLIRTLAGLGIEAGIRPGLTGVWTGGRKVAAIGIHVSQWVTMHGFAINVAPNLAHFRGIVPCGLSGEEVTAIAELVEETPTVWQLAPRVTRHFAAVFELELELVSWAALESETGA